MLLIRQEQMDTFSLLDVDKANQKLVLYAQQRFPNEFSHANDMTILEFVQRIRAVGAQYGVQRENDVATFLDFAVMYGEDFHQATWAEDVLNCVDMHGPDKMELLRFRIRETDVDL